MLSTDIRAEAVAASAGHAVNVSAVATKRPRMTGICMYTSVRPYNGGSSRVFYLAQHCSNYFDVTYYAQKLQPSYLWRRRVAEVSPSYREFQGIDLASFVSGALSAFVDLPQLAQSPAMRTAAPQWLRAAAANSELLVVNQPWQYAWARRYRTTRAKIVYDAQNVEADLLATRNVRLPAPVSSALLRFARLQEQNALKDADLILATSDEDAARLTEICGSARNRIRIIPNGVDCTLFDISSEPQRAAAKRLIQLSGRDVVLFAGAKHPPNRRAVERILGWARAWRDERTVFVIAGSIGEWYKGLDVPNVRFTGAVRDISVFFRAADVALNPLTEGSGTNLKQLEYLAAGVASITTGFGARGLSLEDGRHALIRPVDEIPSAIATLFRDVGLREQLRMQGRAHVLRRFDWGAIGMRLLDEYRSLLETGSA